MHVIIVTVGLSIIEKTWKGRKKLYEDLMGSEDRTNRGILSDCKIEEVENGTGWKARSGIAAQIDIEKECFAISESLPHISNEIKRRKKNRYSAEVSSLYAVLTDKHLKAQECRIVLVATDSSEGIFAARLNKRIIAHRLFGCDKDTILRWNTEADNTLAPAFAQIPILRVQDLQVRDAENSERNGNRSLQRAIHNQTAYLSPGDVRIVNITGGFKGVIPVTVGIAWRYGWEVIYLYEETEKYLVLKRPEWIRIVPQKDEEGGELAVPIQHRPAVA